MVAGKVPRHGRKRVSSILDIGKRGGITGQQLVLGCLYSVLPKKVQLSFRSPVTLTSLGSHDEFGRVHLRYL